MNKQIIFKKRPIGFPDETTWNLESNPIPELKEGEVLVQQHYISLDPAMRGWMNEGKSYIYIIYLFMLNRHLDFLYCVIFNIYSI